MALLGLVAFALRRYRLADIPPTRLQDEAAVADAGNGRSVLFDRDGSLLAVDKGPQTVVRLTADGRTAARAGTVARFESPTTVAVDAHGSLYVLDGMRNQVVRFDVAHRLGAPCAGMAARWNLADG